MKIIKTFRQHVPAMRFIGKAYGEFGHWGDWFANGWFEEIERAMGGADTICRQWENGGGYVGLERRKEGEPFVYWIGMFTPAGTAVPEGFRSIDFPAGNLGICWLYGSEGDVHQTGGCRGQLASQGMEVLPDADGAVWSFENCLCPRYTTPDETGNIILDYCFFIKE